MVDRPGVVLVRHLNGGRKNMHILVVEDEFRTAAIVRELLEDLGFASIEVAETEEEAVDSALRRRPHLIISDVQLREGLGPLAVKRIRSALGPIKRFYLTGSPQSARQHDPGATILSKPIIRQQLSAAILSHVRADASPYPITNVA